MSFNQLNREVDQNGQLRNCVFEYHYNNNPTWQAAGEYPSRLQFENAMQNPNQRRVLLSTFLPEYTPSRRGSGGSDGPRRPRTEPSNPQFSRALSKAAVVGATGLAAVILGSMSDDPNIAEKLPYYGQIVMGAAGLGALISYVKYR